MSAPPAPGTRLAGYVLDAEVGRGGMGVVYRAHDEALGRVVAVKVVAGELAGSADARRRFLREARAAARVEHPSVLPVYGAGEQDGRLWLATRFVDGTDLGRVLRADGPLGLDDAIEVAGQVAGALDAAHAEGVVHRDVKPANILLSARDGRAYLADFGLSVLQGEGTQTAAGGRAGTLSYMAPERVRGAPSDGRADVYALACVLLELATGRPPFGTDPIACLTGHVEAPVPRLDPHAPPCDLDRVISTAMAKRPEDRYRTAGDLVRAARGAARQPASRAAWERAGHAGGPAPVAPEASDAGTVAPGAPPPRAPRRRRMLAALAAGGVVLAGAGVALVVSAGGADDRGAGPPAAACASVRAGGARVASCRVGGPAVREGALEVRVPALRQAAWLDRRAGDGPLVAGAGRSLARAEVVVTNRGTAPVRPFCGLGLTLVYRQVSGAHPNAAPVPAAAGLEADARCTPLAPGATRTLLVGFRMAGSASRPVALAVWDPGQPGDAAGTRDWARFTLSTVRVPATPGGKGAAGSPV